MELPVTPGFTTNRLKLGRQTLDVGSRRVLERVEMANVISSYTGAYWQATTANGSELHALVFVPTARAPADRNALERNDLSGDEEQWGRRAWGLHARAANALGTRVPNVWAEAYVYGLQERDTASVPTPNRDYIQPGVRLFRAPRVGQFDFDIETALRTGTRRATSAQSDTRDLHVDAHFLAASLSYTFDAPLRPRVTIHHFFASGDQDPTDANYNQFERLFGSRRGDLGNTGIFGPLTTANISAPGARLEVRPNNQMDFRFTYKAASLAQARDAWIDAGLQDATGQSGRFIDHTVEFRGRFQLRPDSLSLEIGSSALFLGRFAREAPNAPRTGDTLFSYIQINQSF
ncbi:MAG: alginate export family protein [Caulobacterales bacterium]